ncbi:insulinase family protein [Paenibacillus sp. IB182496]|uniref:Insulinase family protein n=1 Tax=Paenibacillus sabuli TaxID=2772509 RepID=A0A927GR92_9BACL|nr:pitrilysin family protein [Paenibacillus sabuli]MBD2845223.1 insulinase family protein [Paenibacillus sabuli]
MQKLDYPRIKETLYHETLPNGLQVYLLPKPGFQKTYATFTTKFGSVDNWFVADGSKEVKALDGIAHFLEHKMFEEPSGDIFATFASQGAAANAFTSFDRTAYLFSATGQLEENVTTLLDFVQHPYFTDANVDKEKGIIEQEINMYKDNPDWRVYTNLIGAMYQKNSVRIDIAGSVESIRAITKEDLYTCYETFYHPSNMLLFVVGGFDHKQLAELVRSNQQSKTFAPQTTLELKREEEPAAVGEAKVEAILPVSLPKCLFGYKDKQAVKDSMQLQRRDVVTKLLLDTLLGPSSRLYQELYDERLISDGFGYEFNSSLHYGFSIIGGDTRDPDELLRRVTAALEQHARDGLDQQAFERTRRKRIGSYLRLLNSPEAIANEFTRHKFRGGDLFEQLQLLEQVSIAEAEERARLHFDPQQLAISIVSKGSDA